MMDSVKSGDPANFPSEPQTNLPERGKLSHWPRFLKFSLGAVAVAAIIATGLFLWPRAWGRYYAQKGLRLYHEQNFSRARESFERSLQFNPRNPVVYFYLGEIALGIPDPEGDLSFYYPAADFQKAAAAYEEALRLDLQETRPELYQEALNDLGFSYWMMNDRDRADGLFLTLIGLKPRAHIARRLLALDYYERLNKPEGAQRLLQDLPLLISSDLHRRSLYWVYMMLAQLAWFFGDLENTMSYTDLVLETAPAGLESAKWAGVSAHMRRAFVYAKKQNLNDALNEHGLAMSLVASSLNYSPAWNGECARALIYFYATKNQRAIEIAASGLGTRTDYYALWCVEVLARSNLIEGNKDEARGYLEQYLKLSDAFEFKDILVARNREEFQSKLSRY